MVGLRAQLRNNRFPQLAKQLKGQEREARIRAAKIGATVARQLCPVSDNNDPGHKHLIDTIAVYIGPSGGVKLIAGDEDVYWGVFVNYGTVFVAPVPFFTMGTEAARKQLPKEYRRMRIR